MSRRLRYHAAVSLDVIQHMIWHEGYHQGQVKLALKLAGRPISNTDAGPATWRVWANKA